MIVTGLSERDKSKIRVEIDGQFAFVLYKGELSRYGVKQGEELSPENYRIITQEILPKRVKLRAMNLLKSRAYTTMQLREKLRAGEYSEEFIALAIDYVSSFGYLDDRMYAADFVEYNKESKSKRRIQMDLQKKGISKELFEEVWEETAGDAQKELETKEFVAKTGGGAVEAAVNGKKEVLRLVLNEEIVDPEDIETLQDAIVAAVNEAMRQADSASAELMGKMTGGLGGLPF